MSSSGYNQAMAGGDPMLGVLEVTLAGLCPSERRFSVELEALYEATTKPLRLKRLSHFLLVMLVMNTFCLLLDAHVGVRTLRLGLWLRLGLYVPATSISILYLRSGRASGMLSGLSAGMTMLVSTVVALVLARSVPEPFSDRYLLGITVAIFAQTLCAPMPLRYAIPGLMASIGTLCVLAFVQIPSRFGPPISPDLPCFLSACGLALIYAMRNRDYEDRKDFLLMEINALRLSEMVRLNSRLERLSSIDALTGIFNRRYLDGAFERLWELACRQKRPIAILMVDIDHFKKINDENGHQQGDLCLEQVAQVIQQSIRIGMDTVGRYGGEEFMVILPEADEAETRAIGERIRASVEVLVLDGLVSCSVTVSIGAARVDTATTRTKRELIAIADLALYRAKRSGRNRLCWGADYASEAMDQRTEALSESNQRFTEGNEGNL